MTHSSKTCVVGIIMSIALLFFLHISVSNAQNILSGISGLQLKTSTDYPAPGQEVTITADSYSMDINSANISWSVNGTTKQNSVGATKLVVKAPDFGKKLNVVVVATTPGGSAITNSIVVSSGSVDMIMESDGYVPPFFYGKIQPAYQNTIKVIAIPHIADGSNKEYDPKTLIYQWRKNSQVMQDVSGYGRQSVSLKGDIIPRPYSLSVTVSTRDGTSQVAGTVSVTPQDPFINFYSNDPLYGPLFNIALGNNLRIGSQKETGVLAVPYGFNENKAGSNLKLSWLINNVEHTELSASKSIILRVPDDGIGSSNIRLNITNDSDILQRAVANFTATFSAKPSDDGADTVTF